MTPKVLIIGANGYIGKKLLMKIPNGFIIKTFSPSINNKNNHDRRIKSYFGSIFDKDALNKVIEPGDIVINLAGTTSLETSWEKHFEMNVRAQGILLQECCNKKVNKIIITSTGNSYVPMNRPSKESDSLFPQDIYAFTKKIGEDTCNFFSELNKMPVIILRISSVYGAHQNKGVVSTMIESIKEFGEISIPYKTIERDFISVDDVVSGIIKAINYKTNKCEIFNIGTGKTIDLYSLALSIIKFFPKSAIIKFVKNDNKLVKTWLDISKAQRLLGFYPKEQLLKDLRKIISAYDV